MGLAVTIGPQGFLLHPPPAKADDDPPRSRPSLLPFLGGAMHYYQVHRSSWERCLDAFVDLGLPLVQTAVPWAIHEQEPGRFDFGDGPSRDGLERDLGGFLEACAERNLKVILRPGPNVNAELTGFGFPERVLADERCLAVGARGNRVILPTPPRTFALPSYASTRFHAEVAGWLRAFGAFAAPHCFPDGPVVAIHVDNELSFFYRTGAYDQDYHPDAVTLYRRFLGQRYPDGLPQAYGPTPLAELDPPRVFEAEEPTHLVPHLDWVAFKEWLVAWALQRMSRVLRLEVDQVPLLHNLPAARWGEPCSLSSVEEKLDLVGSNVFFRGHEYPAAKQSAQLVSGASRLPVAMELGWGCWPWWFPRSVMDQQAAALTQLMHGIKGFILYMAVERDRWYGAPVRADGGTRQGCYQTVKRLMTAYSSLDWPTLERPVPVALMRVRDYERLTLCSSLADPISPYYLELIGLGRQAVAPEQTFGFEGPAALDYTRTLDEASAALDALEVPYHLVDSDLSDEKLAGYQLLVVPGLDFMDRALVERLGAFVARGGAVVLLGKVPALDARMTPLAAAFPEHTLARAGEAEAAIADRVGHLDLGRAVKAGDPEVDLCLYQRGGQPQVLFAANRGDQPRECEVILSDDLTRPLEDERPGWRVDSFCDALTGEAADLDHLHLEPFEVRMLRRCIRGGSRDAA